MSNTETLEWKKDYPIKRSAEHDVGRRQFVKTSCGCALAVGSGLVSKDRLLRPPAATEPMAVAMVADLAVGDSRLFRYPTEDQPCILVRLSETEFAAFSQSCTHLSCPVHYQHADKLLFCPCHEGYFSAADGRVLAGPPPSPLPRYPVEIRNGEIWVSPAQAI
jgi:Rieske Fe-S protein